jgi:hypothetical protein
MTSTTGNGHHKTYDLPKPHPDLSAEEVVKIVLEALQHNDAPCADCGIETTFNFASPANRAVTGPLPRFVEMVRNPMYQPLLHFDRVEFEPINLEGDHAEQRVKVFDANGDSAVFVWMLTRQPGPAWKDCWMTDSVIRVE